MLKAVHGGMLAYLNRKTEHLRLFYGEILNCRMHSGTAPPPRPRGLWTLSIMDWVMSMPTTRPLLPTASAAPKATNPVPVATSRTASPAYS